MQKPILYHQPGSRSSRAAWVLFELEASGMDLEEIISINYLDFSKGEHKSESYLKVNPFGTTPAYVDENGETMIESGAIVLHFSKKFEEKLNLISTNKAKYYQWIVMATSTLDSALTPLYFQLKYTPKEKQNEKLIEERTKSSKNLLQFIETSLGTNDYLVDNKFSSADIVLGYTLALSAQIELLKDFPNLGKYVERLGKREAFKKSFWTKRIR